MNPKMTQTCISEKRKIFLRRNNSKVLKDTYLTLARGGKLHFIITIFLVFMGITTFSSSLNMLENSGFENVSNGAPDGWLLQPDKMCEISLDTTIKHNGSQALRLTNKNSDHYSKVRHRKAVLVTPNTDCTLQAWVRTENSPLKAENEKSLGFRLYVNDSKGKTLGVSSRIISTLGEWRLVSIKFNTKNNDKIFIMCYLHYAAGTIWVDDFELFAGNSPSLDNTSQKSKSVLGENSFPKVRFYPGAIFNQGIFYLFDNDLTPLMMSFYNEIDNKEETNLIIETPPGVFIIADLANKLLPVGEEVGQNFTKYTLKVPYIGNKPSDRNAQVLLFKTTKDFENNTMLSYYFARGNSKTDPKSFKLATVSWPIISSKTPKNFVFEAYYAFNLESDSKDENTILLLKELADTYLKAGLSGSVAIRTPLEIKTYLQEKSWKFFTLSGFGPSYLEKFYRSKISYALDKNGNQFPKNIPCITWMLNNNIMDYICSSTYKYYRDHANFEDSDFDYWIFDHEPHSKGWQNCVCPDCMKAFAVWLKVEDSKIDPDMIENELREKWQTFREQQNAEIVANIAKFARKITKNQSLKFGFCANPDAPWSPAAMDPYVDFHGPMIYYRHPAAFFETVQREVKRVNKPFIPAISVDHIGATHWTSPSALKLQLLSTAAAGGKGMSIWTGTHNLDALGLVKIREALNAIATFEPYFEKNDRIDHIAKVTPCVKNQSTGYMVHQLEGRFLISLFNFDSKENARINIILPRLNDGKYILNLPIENITLLPANGKLKTLWEASDLQHGFTFDIPVGETRFLELIPEAEKPSIMDQQIKTLIPSDFFEETPYILRASHFAVSSDENVVIVKDFWGKGALAKEQTEAFGYYDDENLYLTVNCHDTFVDTIKATCKERDGQVHKDDCVEFFLQSGNPHLYYHIIVNSLGTVFDRIVYFSGNQPDESWDSSALVTATVLKNKKLWEVKIIIPWKALSLNNPKPGTEIKLNICRSRKPSVFNNNQGENSSWVPCYGVFNPPTFGELIIQEK